jgi:hypothetical protein
VDLGSGCTEDLQDAVHSVSLDIGDANMVARQFEVAGNAFIRVCSHKGY